MWDVFLSVNLKMVRERDTFWNPFLESVLKVDAKLTKLGFIHLAGEVAIIEPNGEGGC
jgi:hypothetical protein